VILLRRKADKIRSQLRCGTLSPLEVEDAMMATLRAMGPRALTERVSDSVVDEVQRALDSLAAAKSQQRAAEQGRAMEQQQREHEQRVAELQRRAEDSDRARGAAGLVGRAASPTVGYRAPDPAPAPAPAPASPHAPAQARAASPAPSSPSAAAARAGSPSPTAFAAPFDPFAPKRLPLARRPQAEPDEYALLMSAQAERQESEQRRAAERERQVNSRMREEQLRQMSEHEEMRAREREAKRQSLQRIQQEVEQWRKEMERARETRLEQQRAMLDSCTRFTEDKHLSERERAAREKEYEQALLQFAKSRDELLAQREIEARERMREHMHDIAVDNERQQQRRRMAKQQEVEEDARLLQQYTEILERQEQQRKAFLARIHTTQEQASQKHADIHRQQIERERETDKKLVAQMQERSRLAEEAELRRAQSRRQLARENVSALDSQVRFKHEQAARARQELEQERLRCERMAQEEIAQQKKLLEQQQSVKDQYRSQLTQQAQLDRERRERADKMSERERRYHGVAQGEGPRAASPTSPLAAPQPSPRSRSQFGNAALQMLH
jgi:hypothetical protein